MSHRRPLTQRRAGFSTIEIAFVLGIISILSAVAIPAIQVIKTKVRITLQLTTARDIFRSINQYVQTNGHLPVTSPGTSAIVGGWNPTYATIGQNETWKSNDDWPLIDYRMEGAIQFRVRVNGILDDDRTNNQVMLVIAGQPFREGHETLYFHYFAMDNAGYNYDPNTASVVQLWDGAGYTSRTMEKDEKIQ